jgi:hypothetical protein
MHMFIGGAAVRNTIIYWSVRICIYVLLQLTPPSLLRPFIVKPRYSFALFVSIKNKSEKIRKKKKRG